MTLFCICDSKVIDEAFAKGRSQFFYRYNTYRIYVLLYLVARLTPHKNSSRYSYSFLGNRFFFRISRLRRHHPRTRKE
jgi:hypothetical protein